MSEPIVLQSNQNDAMISSDGVCYTLTASMGLGGGYVPMIVDHESGGIDSEPLGFTGESGDRF